MQKIGHYNVVVFITLPQPAGMKDRFLGLLLRLALMIRLNKLI